MKIFESIYQQMISLPQVPPESGGILGTSEGEIVDCFIYDEGIVSENYCVYAPNVVFLNQRIVKWREKGIRFLGVFHTHALQWPSLSNADKDYIIDILTAMPSDVESLFFPLIFPGGYIKSYIGVRSGKEADIFVDDIEIIKEEEGTKNERSK